MKVCCHCIKKCICPNKTTGIAAVQLVQYCNLPLLPLWWGKNMWFAGEAELTMVLLWCCPRKYWVGNLEMSQWRFEM